MTSQKSSLSHAGILKDENEKEKVFIFLQKEKKNKK